MKKYGLGWTLAALWLGSWAIHAWTLALVQGWKFGDTLTRPEFWRQTMENWQSEFLQVLTMVVLTAVLVFKGSAESRDSNDRLEEKVDRILETIGDKGA